MIRVGNRKNSLFILRTSVNNTFRLTTNTKIRPTTSKRLYNSNNSNSKNSNSTSTTKTKTNTTTEEISTTGPLFPYSNSLPSPGYEWCRKCNIPSRHLQKEIGKPNLCMMTMQQSENELSLLKSSASSSSSSSSSSSLSSRQQEPFRGPVMNWVVFGTGFCRPAKQYYKQQIQIMIFLTAIIFVALPPWEKDIDDHDIEVVEVVEDHGDEKNKDRVKGTAVVVEEKPPRHV